MQYLFFDYGGFFEAFFCAEGAYKKRASDGNRRPVLTSETTKRKRFMLNDNNSYFRDGL